MKTLKPIIVKDVPIRRIRARGGRGKIAFPEWLDLCVSKDGTKGDCLVYPDTTENRKLLTGAKGKYNRATTGKFAGKCFVHRYEVHHGEPVIVIQRIV